MQTKQYRITKRPSFGTRNGYTYYLQVTHGLCDVEPLGVFNKQSEARAAANAHAERTNVKPVILT